MAMGLFRRKCVIGESDTEKLIGAFVNFARAFNDLALEVQHMRKDILKMSQQVLDAVTALNNRVSAETDANKAAIAAITGLAQQLKDALANAGQGDDAAVLAQVQAVSDAIDANTKALGDAVTANTVSATPTQQGGTTTPQA